MAPCDLLCDLNSIWIYTGILSLKEAKSGKNEEIAAETGESQLQNEGKTKSLVRITRLGQSKL